LQNRFLNSWQYFKNADNKLECSSLFFFSVGQISLDQMPVGQMVFDKKTPNLIEDALVQET
jgi:hypothetical protein